MAIKEITINVCWSGTHIYFHNMGQIGKKITDTYEVTSSSGVLLGIINWYSQWRKYAFSATDYSMVFEETCLRDIAAFIEQQTRAHKEAKKRKDQA